MALFGIENYIWKEREYNFIAYKHQLEKSQRQAMKTPIMTESEIRLYFNQQTTFSEKLSYILPKPLV